MERAGRTSISKALPQLIAALAGDSEQARINLRANQVRERYKRAIETVYRAAAPLHLAHTNNVYILKKDGVRTLIVYVDESIFAAELNAQRELIKLHLLELFGEEIEQFEIHVSRGRYKQNHPYLTGSDAENAAVADKNTPDVPLTADEESYVSNTVSTVEDKRLQKALEKAMTADIKWKKTEKRSQS